MMRLVLLVLLLAFLLFSDTDGKRKGSSTRKSKNKEPSGVRKLKKALDPARVLNPKKDKAGGVDLAKIAEETIVNEHLRLSTQVMNWLHKVVDVGKGIANGVCRTVSHL